MIGLTGPLGDCAVIGWRDDALIDFIRIRIEQCALLIDSRDLRICCKFSLEGFRYVAPLSVRWRRGGMLNFKGSQFEREIILWAVRWYVAYPISYRQLEEMIGERGYVTNQ